MLQTLSKDKAFGHTLNRPFDGHASLPASVRIHNFHGTYGDYLICVCELTCSVVAVILLPMFDLIRRVQVSVYVFSILTYVRFTIICLVHSALNCHNKEDTTIALPGSDFDAFERLAVHSKHLAVGVKPTFAVDDLVCFTVVPPSRRIQPQAFGDLVGHSDKHSLLPSNA